MTLENSFILVLRGAHHKMTASTKKQKFGVIHSKGFLYGNNKRHYYAPNLYLNDTTTFNFQAPTNFFSIGWMSQKLT